MTDYISREAAKMRVVEALGQGHSPYNAIVMLPAADVREVVLCRDCQNSYEWANVDGDNYRYCGYLRSRWNHDTDRMVNDDDFCKWGKKREEQT